MKKTLYTFLVWNFLLFVAGLSDIVFYRNLTSVEGMTISWTQPALVSITSFLILLSIYYGMHQLLFGKNFYLKLEIKQEDIDKLRNSMFDAARGMKFLTYAAPAIRNAMMDMVRDAFAAFEQRMVTEDKDGICYQRVSLDDVLPGEEQLRRIEAIADPYAMQPQIIMEEQESRRELYDGLKRLTQREQTYLLYRYGFTDGEEHPLIGTAIYFHLTKGRAQKTEEQAMDNLWLELPWWFI